MSIGPGLALRRCRRALAAALLVAAMTACGGFADVPRIEVGRPAPAYSAITLTGDTVSLEGLRGRTVLLNIWATWCFPCREEIPELQALHEQFAGEGLEVVGVSIDAHGNQQAIRDFADQFNVSYTIWHDPDSRIINTFLSLGVPTTFLIDSDGIIRWRHMGVVRATDRTLREAMARAGIPADAPREDAAG